MSSATDQSARFHLDLVRFELFDNGLRVRLERQPMELLILLAERQGELVSREEIAARFWGKDVFVDTNMSINRIVRKLRLALGDDPQHPQFMETVVGKGYRFVGPIRVTAKESPNHPTPVTPNPSGLSISSEETAEEAIAPSLPRSSKWWSRVAILVALGAAVAVAIFRMPSVRDRVRARAASSEVHSLAILPLENLSGDPEQEYFADGMTDELITYLSKISALRVISRTSVMRYRNAQKPMAQIGKELGVDAVIEGTVVRSGDKIRITVKLVHTPTDRHLWSEEYTRDFRDVLLLQSEVARDIARQIRVRLTQQEQAQLSRVGPVNPDVHELYLRGLYFSNKWTIDGEKRAIGLFEQALQKDPGYAPAYAALGVAYGVLGIYGDVHAYTQAKSVAQKALELDESLPEAHNVLAWAEFTYDWDVAAAEWEFRRAIELNPSYATGHAWYGMFLGMLGRLGESLQESEQGRRLDPLSLPNITLVWRTYYNGHQYDKAIEVCREALDMDPTFVRARERLVTILEQKGDFEKAIEEHRQVYLLHGENRGEADREADSLQKALVRDGPRGYWLAKLKRFPSAKSLTGTTYSDIIEFAVIQTRLGNKQDAFLSLQKACESHVPYLIWVLPGDPAFDPIRSDPRYKELLRCVHVAQ
jgi:TolB-like protein/DNA-binding winged helix-turn-helix (wHTH) protein/Tfp pilus assembly protein PilF